MVIIDGAVSSGRTLMATLDLLERVGCVIEGCVLVMGQGEEWKGLLGEKSTVKVVCVLEDPLLRAVDGGWDLR